MQKFGVLLDPLTMRFTQAKFEDIYKCANATEQPFVSTYLPLRSLIAQRRLTGTYTFNFEHWRSY